MSGRYSATKTTSSKLTQKPKIIQADRRDTSADSRSSYTTKNSSYHTSSASVTTVSSNNSRPRQSDRAVSQSSETSRRDGERVVYRDYHARDYEVSHIYRNSAGTHSGARDTKVINYNRPAHTTPSNDYQRRQAEQQTYRERTPR